jgi:hypothetical protein
MKSPTTSLPTRLTLRFAIAATLAVSGVIHAYLYIDGGYRYIPTVGSGFLVQASIFCALAVLVLVGGPDWCSWAGGVLSVGALIAFVLSRTMGPFGFTERGWSPSPYAALSVIAEALTVVLVAASVLAKRRGVKEIEPTARNALARNPSSRPAVLTSEPDDCSEDWPPLPAVTAGCRCAYRRGAARPVLVPIKGRRR